MKKKIAEQNSIIKSRLPLPVITAIVSQHP